MAIVTHKYVVVAATYRNGKLIEPDPKGKEKVFFAVSGGEDGVPPAILNSRALLPADEVTQAAYVAAHGKAVAGHERAHESAKLPDDKDAAARALRSANAKWHHSHFRREVLAKAEAEKAAKAEAKK